MSPGHRINTRVVAYATTMPGDMELVIAIENGMELA
jgi:hypothetical protein